MRDGRNRPAAGSVPLPRQQQRGPQVDRHRRQPVEQRTRREHHRTPGHGGPTPNAAAGRRAPAGTTPPRHRRQPSPAPRHRPDPRSAHRPPPPPRPRPPRQPQHQRHLPPGGAPSGRSRPLCAAPAPPPQDQSTPLRSRHREGTPPSMGPASRKHDPPTTQPAPVGGHARRGCGQPRAFPAAVSTLPHRGPGGEPGGCPAVRPGCGRPAREPAGPAGCRRSGPGGPRSCPGYRSLGDLEAAWVRTRGEGRVGRRRTPPERRADRGELGEALAEAVVHVDQLAIDAMWGVPSRPGAGGGLSDDLGPIRPSAAPGGPGGRSGRCGGAMMVSLAWLLGRGAAEVVAGRGGVGPAVPRPSRRRGR